MHFDVLKKERILRLQNHLVADYGIEFIILYTVSQLSNFIFF